MLTLKADPKINKSFKENLIAGEISEPPECLQSSLRVRVLAHILLFFRDLPLREQTEEMKTRNYRANTILQFLEEMRNVQAVFQQANQASSLSAARQGIQSHAYMDKKFKVLGLATPRSPDDNVLLKGGILREIRISLAVSYV